MNGARHGQQPGAGASVGDFTREPAAITGQLDYESTFTAPTEWVPYVYTDAELQTIESRRGVSVAALVCGSAGLVIAIFGVWGAPLSFLAIVLALWARSTERLATPRWGYSLALGLTGLVFVGIWIAIISAAMDSLTSA
ncbi:hypothetical protein GCM10022381_28520 [Leifsonia kafniensis]|uniref:DUF4190 domain-containing protein n=1 Tax=Leifsonia kafniensis TaxID=475957 RepID=A0ABP7KSA5_9MICO